MLGNTPKSFDSLTFSIIDAQKRIVLQKKWAEVENISNK
jgi:hypothetical protein